MAPVVEYPGSRPYSIAQPERAYDERAYRIVTLSVGDRWDPPRRERRFPELKDRLTDDVLFGQLAKGGKVVVDVGEDRLVFRIDS